MAQSLFSHARSISAESIIAVMSQMKDATRNLASSTKTRLIFPTNFGSTFDPLVLEATQGRQRFLEVKAMPYGYRVGTEKIERNHQLLRYTLISSSVAWCV